MPDTQLRRSVLMESDGWGPEGNIGLFLSRGPAIWPGNSTDKGTVFQKHVSLAATLPAPEIYKKAYDRWLGHIAANPTIAAWTGRLEGRLFIGMGGASVLETAITIGRPYGVPVIPGSAVKGLVRAYASTSGVTAEHCTVLFGNLTDPSENVSEAGCVIFHDAWWVPGSAETPLAKEVVTVHHPDYYQTSGGQDATDFDSPVPNVQIAARGGFLFTVECAGRPWADFALELTASALEEWGVGAKTAAGYGRFRHDPELEAKLAGKRDELRLAALSPRERIEAEIEKLTPARLAVMLGRDRQKTKREWGPEWDYRIALVKKIHGDLIGGWAESTKKNQQKAYKTVFGHP